MSFEDTIQQDLVAAMRDREPLRLGALRMIKTALRNKAVEKRGPLSGDEERAVLQTLLKQRREAAEAFRGGGRAEMADREDAEAALIEAYLPGAATEEEIRAAIGEAVAETGATGPADMGKVMKAAMPRLASKTVDGRRVSALVKERLGSK
jgi:uncharacterized protein YqeY